MAHSMALPTAQDDEVAALIHEELVHLEALPGLSSRVRRCCLLVVTYAEGEAHLLQTVH